MGHKIHGDLHESEPILHEVIINISKVEYYKHNYYKIDESSIFLTCWLSWQKRDVPHFAWRKWKATFIPTSGALQFNLFHALLGWLYCCDWNRLVLLLGRVFKKDLMNKGAFGGRGWLEMAGRQIDPADRSVGRRNEEDRVAAGRDK